MVAIRTIPAGVHVEIIETLGGLNLVLIDIFWDDDRAWILYRYDKDSFRDARLISA